MLRRLAVHAGRHGVRRIHGDVLWGNEPMLALVRGLGGAFERHPTDATLVRAVFDVATAAAPLRWRVPFAI
jgi:hypothetical protein